MNKNKCGKMRDKSNPYEIWILETTGGLWEWFVLKKYQTPRNEARNPYARWMCAVRSPNTFGGFDMGDVYAQDIINVGAYRIKRINDYLKFNGTIEGSIGDAFGVIRDPIYDDGEVD